MRIVTITSEAHGAIIGDRIKVAETSLSRMVGLLGKRSIDAGEGLWIRPSSGVHTVGMTFPIDVVGLDQQRRVVRLWPNLVPYRITSVSFKVASVIELPAGSIQSSRIQLGDRLLIQ